MLAAGSWYSFTLQQDGIYQVTGQDLNALGMSLPVSSSSIALFGNGGKMLPEANATARIEDLREIPIQIFDGGDGSFDKNDYFLFYGESPHGWAYDTLTGYFSHTLNIYSDSTRYFITNSAGIGEKKRIATVDNSNLTATATVSEYTYYDFREDDLYNPWESGKEWFGDRFEATLNRSYSFSIPGYKSGSRCRVSVAAAASSVSHSQLTVSTNGSGIGTLSFGPIGNRIASRSRQDFSCTPSGNNLSIVLDYNQPTSSSSAYLDWIEIQVPCLLTMHSSQFSFTNPSTIGHGNVTRFVIIDNLGEQGIPFAIIFTKADKLSSSKIQSHVQCFKNRLQETWESLPPTFVSSAETKKGKEDILQYIEQINQQYNNPNSII